MKAIAIRTVIIKLFAMVATILVKIKNTGAKIIMGPALKEHSRPTSENCSRKTSGRSLYCSLLQSERGRGGGVTITVKEASNDVTRSYYITTITSYKILVKKMPPISAHFSFDF